jgi:hypothetical protein
VATNTDDYYSEGQKDGAKGRDNPPHQGPPLSENYWGSDMGGRPVTDKDKQADYDAYRDGQRNASRQKK